MGEGPRTGKYSMLGVVVIVIFVYCRYRYVSVENNWRTNHIP
jgi:hypothetical protein